MTSTSLSAFGVVLTIIVLLGIAVAILVFERPRSRRIERDLREQAGGRGGPAKGSAEPERDEDA